LTQIGRGAHSEYALSVLRRAAEDLGSRTPRAAGGIAVEALPEVGATELRRATHVELVLALLVGRTLE
jgi:hypothetical protein